MAWSSDRAIVVSPSARRCPADDGRAEQPRHARDRALCCQPARRLDGARTTTRLPTSAATRWGSNHQRGGVLPVALLAATTSTRAPSRTSTSAQRGTPSRRAVSPTARPPAVNGEPTASSTTRARSPLPLTPRPCATNAPTPRPAASRPRPSGPPHLATASGCACRRASASAVRRCWATRSERWAATATARASSSATATAHAPGCCHHGVGGGSGVDHGRRSPPCSTSPRRWSEVAQPTRPQSVGKVMGCSCRGWRAGRNRRSPRRVLVVRDGLDGLDGVPLEGTGSTDSHRLPTDSRKRLEGRRNRLPTPDP